MFYVQAEKIRLLLETIGQAAYRVGDFSTLREVRLMAGNYVQALETLDAQELTRLEGILIRRQEDFRQTLPEDWTAEDDEAGATSRHRSA
ncbi:hypothetical protein MF271_19865 (plasmid) [Deinococcus sp. KNUC1210]|uniref:hypothetical protein n=1 Tax=Deinococcus sp. KNUC1210 TaxID=2917691 RepID=UPI001EF12856|nr:hypothetical protein [Deinococcus sp. KNUC1210]ULH17671.1 hypothetical protein MF271_19865 [Deinococcus sp. KNUC1210]